MAQNDHTFEVAAAMMLPKTKKTNCWLLPGGSEEKPKNEDNRVEKSKKNNKYFRNELTAAAAERP